MTSQGDAINLPFTKTARRYGYIIWRKSHDHKMAAVLGGRKKVDLKIAGALQTKKVIDWKKRRIGITYTLTRNIPDNLTSIRLQMETSDRVTVTFE